MTDKNISSQSSIEPRIRRDFSKIGSIVDIPNLLAIQQESVERFLQMDMLPDDREKIGMQAVFEDIFPIENFSKTASLEFVAYEIGIWECSCGKLKGMQSRYHWRCECGHHEGIGDLLKLREMGQDPGSCPMCAGVPKYITCSHCEKRVELKMKYDVNECIQRGMTFSAPLKVIVRLVVWDEDSSQETRTIRDIKEQEVYLGEIPLMADLSVDRSGHIRIGDKGAFIINGTERVIVSQMHRSPGVFFKHDKGKGHASGKLLYSARVIPYRGAWIEFEFDANDLLHVRIDRKRKLLSTVLLRALGYETDEEILKLFFTPDIFKRKGNVYIREITNTMIGERVPWDVPDPEHPDKMLIRMDKKFTKKAIRDLKKAGLTTLKYSSQDLIGKISVVDIVDMETGEILIENNEEVSIDNCKLLDELKVDELELISVETSPVGLSLHATLAKDKITSREDAQIEIYRRLRPGDPLTPESAASLFDRLFHNPKHYDLSEVGRLKLNKKINAEVSIDQRTLLKEDIVGVMGYLLNLKSGKGSVDDIDHLGNRRVRAVGELLQNQFRIGLVRMERAIRERMSIQDLTAVMPHDLINAKPVSAALNEFFGSSQLSQFMDQTNPLAELTHKRRLSALGPGGLSRERAGFEVRDVHSTHYGRICPIETPEGPNVGLIVSLSTYARVTSHGFIETPYRRVINGKVTNEISYLTALDEDQELSFLGGRKYYIAQASTPKDATGTLLGERINCRFGGEPKLAEPETVDFMDISPKQLVSVSTALIPFLEHDDANRALMGSNMQRQAVPLLKTEAPLVGTGMEHVAVRDSGIVECARRSGVIEAVNANRIILRSEEELDPDAPTVESPVEIYTLTKFKRSNQNTCVNQRPIVKRGQRVRAGQIIADGPATEQGELALGRNILVAFMSWQGYNFEDAILISEKVVKEDLYTSIHIESFEIEARDTKLGTEEITRDIPNVSEEQLRNLDESGIIRIGAEVKPGDVLVGKITPKGETQLTPEEKLLRAIFGEKAGDVRDASLTVQPGIEGTVIDVMVFSRKGVEKDERSKMIEDDQLNRLRKDYDDEITIIRDEEINKIRKVFIGKKIREDFYDPISGELLFKQNDIITGKTIMNVPDVLVDRIPVQQQAQTAPEIEAIKRRTEEQTDIIKMIYEEKVSRIQRGDELPPGVVKLVKVFIAVKRKLQVGDKMAGRHGNKGVISKIVPEQDMPFLPDGTPVEVVLNPLGVPSRMNVGQILETHLGWAAKDLGSRIGRLVNDHQQKNLRELRSLLKEIYKGSEIGNTVDLMSEDEIIELGSQLETGVHMATPVFDGATEKEIAHYLELAELPRDGKTQLFDGRTGEPFDQPVTVGYIYMMKLAHLVDDKIHARSIGPYSLVTQQPLGGKAQFGGQRFGEMEVWALEGYGAAHTLQEMLTVKSDDVLGRTKIYQAIVKGESMLEPGVPESFNVLIKELQALGLDVELLDSSRLDEQSGSGETHQLDDMESEFADRDIQPED
ncbi:DNA-directed RNA polymerase subunit beta [bacterium]|nr:DNA-directed RNA polymerase subunit beta [candidate division CSSED10-310 bacterium]